MGKLPWAKFFYADFIQDTDVLSNRAVGGWMRLLCQMWHKDNGTLELTKKQLSRILRTDENSAMEILQEIHENVIANANITEPHKKITIVSRRISRESKDRENNRIRQERYQNKKKNNALITPQKSEDKKSEDKKSDKNTLKEEKFSTLFWPIYPSRNGKKLDRKKALDQFIKIPEKEIDRVLIAVHNYKLSKTACDGYAKDAHRWLRDKLWNEWMTPDKPIKQPKPEEEDYIAKLDREERERNERESAS